MSPLILLRKFSSPAAVALGALCLGAASAAAGPYVQTDLVSNLSTLGATITDPDLINPWGVSYSPTSPFWVSNQVTNTATLYSITGSTQISKIPLTVTIPTTVPPKEGPTGQVNNTNAASFLLANGQFAHFIFANLNGQISAWNTGTTAQVKVNNPTETYAGLAINTAQTRLYAANDAGAGSIDIFNSSFAPIGTFANDPAATALGLVPFNVQDINGKVYVTYAPAGRPAQQHAALGQGLVAEFDENGNFIGNVVAGGTGSPLAAPWGITFAPPAVGEFSNDLLVGNFSYDHSEINAFDPLTGDLVGTIPIDDGPGNTSGGLWALAFGVGGSNGSPDTLYFTDGINGETDGLFGAFNVPEPSALAIFVSALALLGFCRSRLRRHAAA